MELLTLFLIALGLTFDTFAVSVSAGITVNHIKFWQAVKVAFVLAFFQALMPVIGWFTGVQVKDLISEYDHWVSFSLLFLLGAKMIYESLKPEHEEETKKDPFKPVVLIGIAIATSIDALIIGVSFAFIDVHIWLAAFIIGAMTFLVAMLGMLFGKKTGALLGKKMEIVGGLILIGIGIKILLEHLQVI